MKAYRLFTDGMRFDEVPVPVARDGGVLLRVAGAGACHSDLTVEALAAGGKLPWPMPFTLGHEITGWLETPVAGFAAGAAVAVYSAWGCGACNQCRAGSDNYCERPERLFGPGLGRDGAMAPYVSVPDARYLVPLGDLDPLDAAPLSDAGVTPYHAIKRALPLLVPGAAALAIGIGGLGHMAIQILRALAPVRVIALDASEEKLRLARDLGADATVLAGDDAAARVREANGGRPVDAVFDFVGETSTMDVARKSVRSGGEIALVGLGGGTLPMRQGALPYGVRVSITFYGSIEDLRETIALAQAGRISARVTRYPLDRADEAFAALRDGTLEGRAVVCPNSSSFGAPPLKQA
ncbi:MAG TPA: NAD(P)-dependent alcohol dehydrogenase [Verrucomicrobiae bacterium]|nr:NAD(P)-dependent alcohol dehydrogenase [Verrucomicrobiae bacterium]